MAFPTFWGTATIAAANGTRFLANSTITLGNGAVVSNGTAAVYFQNALFVTGGANNGNIALVPAGNATVANLTPFASGFPGVANVPFKIPPALVVNAVGGNLGTGDANQVYFTASAATTVNIVGY